MKKNRYFIQGIASCGDIFGINVIKLPKSNYHYYKNSNDADYYALKSDWAAIGRDFNTAIEKFEKTTNK